MRTSATGSGATWNVTIWPRFVTLKTEPTPIAFMTSLASNAIHWALKFVVMT